MSNDYQTLDKIITFNDNTDDLLEEKIKENEKLLQNLDIDKSNEYSDKKENSINEIINLNQKIVNENNSEKNGYNNNQNNNNQNINNNNKNISENSYISTNKNKNKSNITSTKTNKVDINKISSELKKTPITSRYNKKISNKKNNDKKNIFKKINNNKNNNTNYLKPNKRLFDDVDQNLIIQYKALNSNNKKNNNSMAKRSFIQNKKRNEINDSKSGNKSKDTSRDKSKDISRDISRDKSKDISRDKSRDKSKDISRDKSRDKSAERFNIIYNKFLEDEKKKLDNIEKLKRRKEEEEKRIYLYKPIINLKSKELVAKNRENNEDFYTRQKKLLEEYKKNNDLLREKIIQKEKEYSTQRFYTQRDRKNEKYKNVKSKLFDWEGKQKIINNEKKTKHEAITKEDDDTENNKSAYKIKVNRNINRIINRLYNKDLEKRKQNLEILNQIYTPSFQPVLFENKNINISNKPRYTDKQKPNNKTTQNMKTIPPKITLDNDDDEEEEKKNEVKDINNIDNMLRDRLFNKVKKKARYTSAIKFDVISDEDLYEPIIEDNQDIKKQLIFKNKKFSNSFIKQKKKYKI